MKSTFARRISILLILAIVLAMLPVTAIATDETITIYLDANAAGMSEPYAWAWGDYGNAFSTWPGEAMVNEGNGVYSITVRADTLSIIFSNNGSGQTDDLTVAGDNTIWNGTEFVDYATYTPVGGEIETFDYYIAGDFNSWNPCSPFYGLSLIDDVYSITFAVEAGEHEFKITNGTWDFSVGAGTGGYGDTSVLAGNITFSCFEAGEVTITYYDSIVPRYEIIGDCLGELPETVITSVNVKGNFADLDWDVALTTGAMALVDGIYTLTIPAVPASQVGDEAYAFKVVVNNSWLSSYPSANWEFYLERNCDVTITYNPANNVVELMADYLTYDVPTCVHSYENYACILCGAVQIFDYYVAGTFNAWKDDDPLFGMSDVDGVYCKTLTNLDAGTYALKVTDGLSWWTAAEDSEYFDANDNDNLGFVVTAACDVVVSFDGTYVSVSGENVTPKAPGTLTLHKVIVAGGMAQDSTISPGNMFNGLIWMVDPDHSENRMYSTEDAPYVFSITFDNVAAGSYDFKFVINDDWANNYSSGSVVNSGVEYDTLYQPLGNSTIVVNKDDSKVTFILDMSNCTSLSDTAKMMVIVDEHNYVGVVTAPTCTASGYTTYTCSECGDSYVANEVAALGHSWVDANCTTPKTCSVCGTTEGEALGHSYEGVVTEPTCTEEGYTTYTCSACGASHVADQVDALGHGNYVYSYINNVHNFTCAACEHTFMVLSTDGKQFRFNTASPALAVDIVMNIATTLPAGFTNPYMVIEFNGVTTTLTEYTVNAGNGRYEFAFPGINPQTMGDTFHATLYATVDSVEVSVQLEYSMLKYINSQLKKTTISDALRTALSDLVMYGEANQVYEGYKTDALLSTLLESTATLTPSTFSGLDSSYNKQATNGTKDANIDLKGVTMALGSKIMVRMTVFCADAAAYTVKATINGEDFLYPVSELALAAGYTDRYVVEFDQIRATQFGEEITFSFLDADGNQVGRTLEYTVYSYVQKNQNVDNESLVNLLKAIYNYGESVKNI